MEFLFMNPLPDDSQLLCRSVFFVIRELLENALGNSAVLHRSSPLSDCENGLEVLLATILTQATNDRNAFHAWRQLKQSFPDPRQLLAASHQKVAGIIRSAGLSGQKATTILKALAIIDDQMGALSLEKLKEASSPRLCAQTALDFLCSLPGIGPKTAACTVLFGLGLPAFPVDTHIFRIIRRLRWIDLKTDPTTAQKILTREIPHQLQADLHILLLNLGREYCRPTKPFCVKTPPYCPLRQECPEYRESELHKNA